MLSFEKNSLKADNILKNGGILKIADLGFAKKTQDLTNTLLGTAYTQAVLMNLISN